MIVFRVEGEPVPKQRPRLGKHGVYTPSKTRAFEELVGWEYRRANPGVPVSLDGRFTVWCRFGIAGRDKDCDNLLKSVLDGLNGVVWADDRQVIMVCAVKEPGNVGFTDVHIEQLGEDNE